MKNIEKIAIDALLNQFIEKYGEMIENAISAKQAAELAQANFKKVAGPLINYAKDSAGILLDDGVSEDAIKYFEDKITEIVKIPFKAKN